MKGSTNDNILSEITYKRVVSPKSSVSSFHLIVYLWSLQSSPALYFPGHPEPLLKAFVRLMLLFDNLPK